MNYKITPKNIITSGIVGVAGGVALATLFPMNAVGLIISGIAGGSFTGYAEYAREKKIKGSHHNIEQV